MNSFSAWFLRAVTMLTCSVISKGRLICSRWNVASLISFDQRILHSVMHSFMEQATGKTFVWILRSFSSPCFQTVSISECYDIGGWKDELAQGVAESLMANFLWNPSQKVGPSKVSIPRRTSQHEGLVLHQKPDLFPSVGLSPLFSTPVFSCLVLLCLSSHFFLSHT